MGLWVLLVAVGIAVILGVVLQRRSGRVTPSTAPQPPEELAALLSEAGVAAAADAPLLVHFSAAWCGPCVGVRHLVEQLGHELTWLRHAE
ncbi:MAG: thioredoxin, partial [Mycobacteriaceae bacterium]